ncbi:hydrogenase maturation protease [Roseospira marina]|uniref:Hydrogenase maturation protease n=1 Tax=Roseospira marina TaxID=140057 RepID=A0A5M6I9M3_9PROT|nr:hydrogenase maturation protease [Roseospira marina]KAA5604893.1 hydrogenase maturation protease [Roseospira marina]MBB4315232.1 hydrogenase maturation protease [Roseospira marina]MBB5088232.1 hydrogenase maturation protease [Roseospira marina]
MPAPEGRVLPDRPRPLVIGVGHPDRGDDALGLIALAHLPASLDLGRVAHVGEGLGLIALWEARGTVVVIDAMDAGRPPGTLLRFTPDSGPMMARAFRTSSHAFGVAEAVETARVLGRLPDRLVLLGLQGACWDLGAPLSAPVAAALPTLLAEVQKGLKDPAGSAPASPVRPAAASP